MYKNILIPVAFEEERDVAGAMEVAARLSGPDAHTTFLHVMEQLPVYAAEYMPADMLAGTRSRAKERLSDLADKVPGGRMAVIDGPTGRSITEWASDNSADLIVIPSHRPVFSDILLGSTAAWVVRHAQCAVHVIR
ncbi:universal stress protein [uncultured Tateyamaria sp.]|uniref:universal stress protein n=1 Tax=uncultured Tateyamaria sp. TaxID=455651 RepID=UPI0026082DFB|nr:universal stress protein [uncultured Tateyamaria sp.]